MRCRMRQLSIMVCCIAAWSVGSLAVQSQTGGSPMAVLYEGGRLITGDGSAAIERSAFLVQNGAFVRVGRQGELKPPPGAVRIALAGKTVMPAMIDVHTHLGYRKDATFRAENFTREILLDELNRFA